MNDQLLNLLLDAVLETALIVTIGGCVLAMLLGLLLLLAPTAYLAISLRLNKWVSTRRSMRPMEIPRNQEALLYRHHRLFGLLIVTGAIYTLNYFLLDYDRQLAFNTLLKELKIEAFTLDWALDAVMFFLMLGNVFVLIIGSVIFIRPSLLKGVEAWGNTWVSTRHTTRFLDNSYSGVDSVTARHPRFVGGFLLLGGLYVLGMLGVYLI